MTREEYDEACKRVKELMEKIRKGIDLSEEELDEFDELSATMEDYEEKANV